MTVFFIINRFSEKCKYILYGMKKVKKAIPITIDSGMAQVDLV